MVAVCSENDLLGKIETLRIEFDAPKTNEGLRKLPQIRIRDKVELASDRLRVRRYSDYLLDKEFSDCAEAANEIIDVLRKMMRTNIAKES